MSSEKSRALFHGLRRAFFVALAWLMLFTMIESSVRDLVVSENSLAARLKAHAAVPDLMDEDYQKLGSTLSRYLLGQSGAVQVNGLTNNRQFDEQELSHLADVRQLFMVAKTIRITAFVAVAVTLLALGLMRVFKHPIPFKSIGTYVVWGFASFGLFLALIALWSALDFNSLFTLLHRLVFSNEDWLLDPSRQLLIQLMPTSFFTSCAIDLGKRLVFIPLTAVLALVGMRQTKKEGADV